MKKGALSVGGLLTAIFIAGMGLMPVYVLPSGLPQPADWILAVWAIITLSLAGQRTVEAYRYPPLLLAIGLVTYIVLVSLVWYLVLKDMAVLFPAIFYVFNLLVMLSFFKLMTRTPFLWRKVLRKAVVSMAFVSFVTFAANFEPTRIRQVGAFNNPNQLGYFALLMVCLGFVVYGRTSWRSWGFWFAISVFTILVLFSSSLSAWVALPVAFLGGLSIIGSSRLIRFMPVFLLIFGVILVSLGQTPVGGHLARQIKTRVNIIEHKTSKVADVRGYSRIIEFPEYIVLGAGEGARYRFGPRHAHELHSSLGTLLFSYGIPGLILFLAVLFFTLRKKPVGYWLIIASPLVYSLTHQGLRNPLFWILLFSVAILGETRVETANKTQVAVASQTPAWANKM